MEELKLEHCHNKLYHHNKIIMKKDYKLKKASKEKGKMVGELEALSKRVQELEKAKEEEAKDAKENANKMKAEVEALEHVLDACEAQSQRNFNKGWQRNATRHGHYIADLYHNLDSTFSVELERGALVLTEGVWQQNLPHPRAFKDRQGEGSQENR